MNTPLHRLFCVFILFFIMLSCRYSGGALQKAPYIPYTVTAIEDVSRDSSDVFNDNIVFITYPDSSEEILYSLQASPIHMRGLYLTENEIIGSNFNNLLQQISEAGLNTIVFDAKDMSGNVFIDIEDYPQLQYTKASLSYNIAELVNLLHTQGFYTIARVVQFYNMATAIQHPKLRVPAKNGGYWQEIEGKPRWLDPSNPFVQGELLEIIDIVASTGVDEVQLDYVRFPTDGDLKQAVFYFETEDIKRLAENPSYKRREKRDVIRDFIGMARIVCDRYNVRLSADVFGIVAWERSVDIRHIGQDIAYISPYLHRVHPMLYSSHFSDDLNTFMPNFKNRPYRLVKQGIEMAIKAAGNNCEVVPYLQAFGMGVNYTSEYIYDQLKAAKDTSVSGYLLWNTYGTYTQTLPWVKEWNKNNITMIQEK